MDKAQIVATLLEHADTLKRRGVERLGLFGSAARGEAKPNSDIDLILTLRPHSLSLFDLVGLQEELEALLGRPVDVTTTPITNPFLAREIDRDLIGVF